MSARFTHAVVTLPALDLRPRPTHRTELASQLLMGEVARIVREGPAGWLEVRNESDGYAGWVRGWGIVRTTAARARRWRARARAVLCEPFAHARIGPGAETVVSPLFWGCRFIPGAARHGWRRVELPDGRRGWLPAGAIRRPGEPPPRLHDRVRTLFGVPYLWGGRTPAGFDCSGLVQQLLLEQGLRLPRDAHEQWRACRPLRAAEAPAAGDLAFFSTSPRARMTHVGLGLGGGAFTHARGTVRMASLDPGDPTFDRDLLPQFRGWHRPRTAPRRAP